MSPISRPAGSGLPDMACPAIPTRTYLYKFRLRRTASGAAIVRPCEPDDYGVLPKDAPPKRCALPGTKIGVNSAEGGFAQKIPGQKILRRSFLCFVGRLSAFRLRPPWPAARS